MENLTMQSMVVPTDDSRHTPRRPHRFHGRKRRARIASLIQQAIIEPVEPRRLLSGVTVTNLGPAHDSLGHVTTGWTSFLFTANADAGDIISAVDMGSLSASQTGKGIFGSLLQQWAIIDGTPTPTPTSTSAAATNGSTTGTDTHILAQNRTDAIAPIEDSDQINPTGAPANTASAEWGTGSYLHGVYAFTSPTAQNLDIAYVVLKDGTIGSYHMDIAETPPGQKAIGFTVDGTFSQSLGGTASPIIEPSLGQTSTANFTVTLGGASSSTITVDYATQDGTALAGTDYDAASGTLTFTPGQTSKTIPVTIHGVAPSANDKTFTLNLSNASAGVAISTPTITETIVQPPTLTAAPSAVDEPPPGQTATETFTFSLSKASVADVTVGYATVDGTALAATDYDAVSGTLTIPAGQTSGTVNVTVHAVNGTSSNKTFSLHLSNVTNASLISSSNIGVTIVYVPVSISASAAPVVEPLTGTTTQEIFTVSLSGPTTADVMVNFTTKDGSATQGVDYDAVAGTLDFAPGDQTKQVAVTVHGVGIQTARDFALELSGPTSQATLPTDPTDVTATIQPLGLEQDFSAGHRLKYTDSNNHPVTMVLIGPGTGRAIFNTMDISTPGDPTQLVLVGTTAASSLIVVSPRGTTTLHTIAVQGSLSVLSASTSTVNGDVTVDGSLRVMLVGDIGGGHVLTISGSAAVPTIIRAGNVTDLSIQDPTGTITALLTRSWSDTDATPDMINVANLKTLSDTGVLEAGMSVGGSLGVVRAVGSIDKGTWTVAGGASAIVAPSIGPAWSATFGGDVPAVVTTGSFAGSLTAHSMRVARFGGDMTGTLKLTGSSADLAGKPALGTLLVTGAISGGMVLSNGDITTVSAGAVLNGATIFAGVSNTVTGSLPTAADQFTGADSILTFSVRGRIGLADAFADAFVAASSIRTVVGRDVLTTNNGTPFGFATNSLTTFIDFEATPFVWRSTQDPTVLQSHLSNDFKVTVFA
jgi:hypothetical protein